MQGVKRSSKPMRRHHGRKGGESMTDSQSPLVRMRGSVQQPQLGEPGVQRRLDSLRDEEEKLKRIDFPSNLSFQLLLLLPLEPMASCFPQPWARAQNPNRVLHAHSTIHIPYNHPGNTKLCGAVIES